MIKRLAILLLSVLCVCSWKELDGTLSGITDSLAEGKRVEARYALAWDSDGTAVLLSGRIYAEGTGFKAVGNGTEVWCDGSSLWIVDPAEKEIYVESAASLADFISSKITSVKDLTLSEVKIGNPDGKAGEFTFDTASLGNEWIVTDLRTK